MMLTDFQLDDSGRRGNDQKLFKKRCRVDIRKFAFSNRNLAFGDKNHKTKTI